MRANSTAVPRRRNDPLGEGGLPRHGAIGARSLGQTAGLLVVLSSEFPTAIAGPDGGGRRCRSTDSLLPRDPETQQAASNDWATYERSRTA